MSDVTRSNPGAPDSPGARDETLDAAREPLLSCVGLTKRFGRALAVDDVSFQIAPGEAYGLLGPNGAGKTTTISILCGLLTADAGRVTLAGTALADAPMTVKAGIGYVPQEVALYHDLTAAENLSFFGRLYGLRGRELGTRVGEVLELVDLSDRARDRIDTFSGGMKRRINIATVNEMTSSVRRRVHVAGVEIPADMGERLEAGERVEVRFHTDPSGTPALEVRTAVAQAIARVGASLRSARLVAARTGIAPEAVLRASESMPSFAATEVVSRTVGVAGSDLPSGFAYSAPAYLILFMFINTLVAAWGLPTDRQRGLTRRAFAAPTGSGAVLLGEWSYRLVVALLQAGLIVIIGAVLFGVDWGHPLAVAAVVVLFALSATGASVLLGSLARTPRQVTALAPPLGIALGMLGGCMWPLEIVGPTMRTIGHATPHAWAVDALMRVVGGGAGPADIATELLMLATFAAGLLALALVVFRRALLSARG